MKLYEAERITIVFFMVVFIFYAVISVDTYLTCTLGIIKSDPLNTLVKRSLSAAKAEYTSPGW